MQNKSRCEIILKVHLFKLEEKTFIMGNEISKGKKYNKLYISRAKVTKMLIIIVKGICANLQQAHNSC